MKFLVILICLMVNYLWLKDFDRFDDGWFFRFRCRIENWVSQLGERYPATGLAAPLLVLAIPMLSLAVILYVTGDSVFGLTTMLVHIFVLLIALDRIQPGQQAKDFLRLWKEGDKSACIEFLRREYNAVDLPDEKDADAIGRYFSKRLTYGSFERMFVMFFWYMVTGPLGVLFAYVSYQLRDSHGEDQVQRQVDFVDLLIQVLEWIPLRLLALTFSLAGNFVQCFDSLRLSFWRFGRDSDNAELLYSYASCATSGMVIQSDEEDSASGEQDRESAEIRAFLGLLERSQAIWLSVLALITIVGL